VKFVNQDRGMKRTRGGGGVIVTGVAGRNEERVGQTRQTDGGETTRFAQKRKANTPTTANKVRRTLTPTERADPTAPAAFGEGEGEETVDGP
jgi:hypothetical protein